MDAAVYPLQDVPEDNPVPNLFRKRVFGEKILLAHIKLEKGCHVALHHHENEQVAYVLSGKVQWTLGAPGSPEHRQIVVEGGTVLHLPSNFPHGVDALEDTLIVDLLSPPGEMGIDKQKD